MPDLSNLMYKAGPGISVADPRKDYKPKQDYTFRNCLTYKEFVSDEDIIREVRKVQRELGYETVEDVKKKGR